MAVSACTPPPEPSGRVYAATIRPLAMILDELVEGRAQVIALIPPGASPHTYAVRPSGARTAQVSLALFYVDDAVDGWAAELSAKRKFAVFEMVTAENRLGDNPHFWPDPLVVAETVPRIVEALCEVDPEGRAAYEKNGKRFIEDLEKLHREIEALLEPIQGAGLVVFHPSWAYFLQRYRIRPVATLEPFPGKEPTPKYLEQVIVAAKSQVAEAVLTEPQLPKRPAEVVAEAANIPLIELDPMGSVGGPQRYGEWLLESARHLREALE